MSFDRIPHVNQKDFEGRQLVPKVSHIPSLKKKCEKKVNFIVMVYADWCGACHRDRPIYSDLFTKYGGDENIVMFALDGSNSKNPLLSVLEIDSFPTYIQYNNYNNKYKKLESIKEVEELLEKKRNKKYNLKISYEPVPLLEKK